MAAEFPTDRGRCAGRGDHRGQAVSPARHAAQRQRRADGSEAVRGRCSRAAGSRSCSWTRCRSSIAPGDGCALTFRVTPPIDAQPTKAYFHRDDPETDAIYKIDDPKYLTLALAAAAGLRREWFTASTALKARFAASPARPCTTTKVKCGRCRWRWCRRSRWRLRPRRRSFWRAANPSAQLSVDVRTTADRGNGTVHPEVPQGWTIEPQSATVNFTASGQQAARIQGAARRREGRLATKCAQF